MSRQITTGAQLGALAVAAVSFLAVRYVGAHVFVPAIGSVVALLLCKKTALGPRRFHWAVNLAFGHLAWFAVGALLVSDAMGVLGDIAVLLVGIAALWVRPSLASALVLGVPTVVFLAIHLYMFASAQVGSLEHRALLVHTLLRLGLLAALLEGVSEIKRLASAAAETPAVEGP